MDIELTNEAAEMIGQYCKGGKEGTLAALMKYGGIVRKEVLYDEGRMPGYEEVLYYYPSGDYACYDPVRTERARASYQESKTA